jgi:hypothetical protein
MKKIIMITVAAIMLFCTSCADQKKGTLIGRCNMNELTAKQKEDFLILWERDIFVKVRLENGDTIHAVMSEKRMCQRLKNNDRAITVTIDGKDKDFYLVNE